MFGRIVENLSDPDFLNCWIIDILSDNTPKRQTEPKQVTKHVAQKDAQDNREPRSVPNTPEPVRSSVHLYEPVIDDEEENTSMVFALGSVNFVIMDISSPEPLNKSQLVYIIQIERPAAEDSVGSEGGGYVITRSYADFENFHTIINARHAKRVARLGLKLPLGATRSWLKSSSTQQQKRGSLDSISSKLEKYLDIVVADEELGTDPILLGFLRKERPSEINDAGTVMSFSEEFKDQVASAYAAESTAKGANGTKSRSLFSRHNQASSKTNLPENNSEKPLSTKSLARQDSASSLGSIVSKEELYEDKQRSNTKQSFISASEPTSRTSTPSSMDELLSTDKTTTTSSKSISSNDVELLIETTYALIVEVFDLTSKNNKAWMRRSILNLLREIVRRSYAEFIIEQYNALANEYMSPKAIVTVLNQLGEKLWPEGKWMLDGKTPKVRTEEDKEKSRQQARDMLLKCTNSSPVRQLVGDQNCDMAMERIWIRYQDKDLNRVLIIQVLERIAKPILG